MMDEICIMNDNRSVGVANPEDVITKLAASAIGGGIDLVSDFTPTRVDRTYVNVYTGRWNSQTKPPKQYVGLSDAIRDCAILNNMPKTIMLPAPFIPVFVLKYSLSGDVRLTTDFCVQELYDTVRSSEGIRGWKPGVGLDDVRAELNNPARINQPLIDSAEDIVKIYHPNSKHVAMPSKPQIPGITANVGSISAVTIFIRAGLGLGTQPVADLELPRITGGVGQPQLPKDDRYPHKCHFCGKPAYIGFNSVQCSSGVKHD